MSANGSDYLKNMLDRGEHHVRRMLLTNRVPELVPYYHFVTEGGNDAILPVALTDFEQKHLVAQLVADLMLEEIIARLEDLLARADAPSPERAPEIVERLEGLRSLEVVSPERLQYALDLMKQVRLRVDGALA